LHCLPVPQADNSRNYFNAQQLCASYGGGLATIFYTLASLLGAAREPTGAVVFAVTGIIGSVLIAGGTYLLHRPDSQGFFTR
jgi:hypothetical protein